MSNHESHPPAFDQLHDYCDERLREWQDEISRRGRHIGARLGTVSVNARLSFGPKARFVTLACLRSYP